MKKIEKDILKLNSRLLTISDNKFDLRTFNHLLKYTRQNWGFSDIYHKINLNEAKNYRAFIPDSDREEIKRLLELISDNPEALKIAENLLTREILYFGSECDRLGAIDIDTEYAAIEKTITSKYLLIRRVETPTISKFIDVWYEIKPKIIIISCHGSEFGLFIQDEEGRCKEYRNTDFFNFFKKRSEYTECVILSSCESLHLGRMITDDGKNVVCINKKVEISTATQYTLHFFNYVNNHSLENSNIYQDAHEASLEKIQFEGLQDSFSFEFIKAKKIF